MAQKFSVEGLENENGDEMTKEITLLRNEIIFNKRKCIMLNLREFQAWEKSADCKTVLQDIELPLTLIKKKADQVTN